MKNEIAIIAVAYNRVDSLSRLLSSLERAMYEDEQPTLIISIDKSKTDEVEKYADEYIWPYGNKFVRKHEINLGLRNHMMSLGEWFDRFDTIVVLEDDIVVSPCFYSYTRQASDKYWGSKEVCGISLYAKNINTNNSLPFSPLKNEYDGYFMNYAMSWGEVWMKPQWLDFYNWYLDHQDFPAMQHLPSNICGWSKSWLKYHIRYCIESNKYFLYPYVSLSTNYGDPGTHHKGLSNYAHQVPLQMGKKKKYIFPDTSKDAICYDGFYENKSLYKILGYEEKNLCIDIGVRKEAFESKKYWLTTKVADFKIIKSFGVTYRPIELNIIFDQKGSDIFLYDTSIQEKNKYKNEYRVLLFLNGQNDLFALVKKAGKKAVMHYIISKIQKKFHIL